MEIFPIQNVKSGRVLLTRARWRNAQETELMPALAAGN
jgi:hypothetical protein